MIGQSSLINLNFNERNATIKFDQFELGKISMKGMLHIGIEDIRNHSDRFRLSKGRNLNERNEVQLIRWNYDGTTGEIVVNANVKGKTDVYSVKLVVQRNINISSNCAPNPKLGVGQSFWGFKDQIKSFQCTCVDHSVHKRMCKHIAALIFYSNR